MAVNMTPFQWGSNGQKMTAEQVKAARARAAEMSGMRNKVAENPWEGLAQLTNAFVERQWREKADAGEAAGRAEIAQLLMGLGPDTDNASLIKILGNGFATSEEHQIAQLLYGQNVQEQQQSAQWEREDARLADQRAYDAGLLTDERQFAIDNRNAEWAREDTQLADEVERNKPVIDAQLAGLLLGNEAAQFELDQKRNPPPVAPEYDFIELPGGQVVRTDATSGVVQEMGQFGTPEPGFTMLTPEQAAANGLDPQKPYQAGPDGRIYDIGGGGVTVENNLGGGGKFEETFAVEDAKALAEVSATGIAANRNLGRIDQLEGLLANAPSGVGALFTQTAGEFGINTAGLSEVQAAQALINSLVPDQRQPGSGPMSDADLDLFKQSLPRLVNQPGGNQTIISTMRAIAQYDAEGAAIVQRLRNEEITRAQAFDLLQARANPLASFKAPPGQDAGAPPPAVSPTAPQGASDPDVDAILNQYGVTNGNP